MTPVIRRLDPDHDRAAVAQFFDAAADYIWLERGVAPGPEVTAEFFTDTPPGCDPAASHRLGLAATADGPLLGLADLAFGYPDATAAFLGLMLLRPEARGRGLGRRFLQHLEATARDSGANTLFLAVLDENPRAMAFWHREGFTVRLTGRPVRLGAKSHTASRLAKPL